MSKTLDEMAEARANTTSPEQNALIKLEALWGLRAGLELAEAVALKHYQKAESECPACAVDWAHECLEEIRALAGGDGA